MMHILSLEDVHRRLSKAGKIRGNRFNAHCPCHDDKRASLSVTSTSGKILMKCHAGCSFEDICQRLNILPTQLFETSGYFGGQCKEVETEYDYFDEFNNLAYQVIRRPGKSFSCRRPGKNGNEWIYDLNGTKRILYKLPQIRSARESLQISPKTICICEGERDVESLARIGILATCNPHGAGKWKSSYAEELIGFDCIVLPDNDDAGRKHAYAVAESLFDKAASIKIVELPDLSEKGDVTDWLTAGHSKEDLLNIVENTDFWHPDQKQRSSSWSGFPLTPIQEFLSESDEELEYVWDETLPVGGISVVSGKPKLGKSTLIRNLALRISQGQPFLGRATMQGKVLYLCLEEIRSQIRNAFKRMGATVEPIHICTQIDPSQFLLDLRSAIEIHQPAIVVIDPMSRVIRETDFNDYAKMTQALEPIVDIARSTNTHIVLVHHDNKTRTGSDGVLGSTAIFGAVDTHIQLSVSDGNKRTVRSTNRYGVDLEESYITLDKETSLVTTGETRKATELKNYEYKVMSHINFGEVVTEKEIKARAGTAGRVSTALRSLCSKKFLTVVSGKGRRGDPYKYEKVAELPLDPTAQF